MFVCVLCARWFRFFFVRSGCLAVDAGWREAVDDGVGVGGVGVGGVGVGGVGLSSGHGCRADAPSGSSLLCGCGITGGHIK